MSEIIKYPPFVDMHVHFREPGTNPAETIASGSLAGLMGGYGYTFDMPNTPGHPTHTLERVDEKLRIAQSDSYTCYGVHAGWQPDNEVHPGELGRMSKHAVGYKIYLTKTTSNDREWEVDDFKPGIASWHEADPNKPILVHPSNYDQVDKLITDVAEGMDQPLHICHVNDVEIAELVSERQGGGAPVTSGVTPHHLVKTSHDVHTHGKFLEMRPPLARQEDTEHLLHLLNVGKIDVVETDHAPHLYEAKMDAENSGGDCFGVPGIDMAFKVLRYQVERGRLDEERLVDAMSTRPAKIMGVKIDEFSYSEWDMRTYRIEQEEDHVYSESGWTPYLGQMATGRLVRVVKQCLPLYSEEEGARKVRSVSINPLVTWRQNGA